MKVIEVDNLDSRSDAVSRNGTYLIKKISLRPAGPQGLVKIACTSKRLNRDLHAGIAIGVSDMDKLARKWLVMRKKESEYSGKTVRESLKKINNALADIKNWSEDIENVI